MENDGCAARSVGYSHPTLPRWRPVSNHVPEFVVLSGFLDPPADNPSGELADLLVAALQDVGLVVELFFDTQLLGLNADRFSYAFQADAVRPDDVRFFRGWRQGFLQVGPIIEQEVFPWQES